MPWRDEKAVHEMVGSSPGLWRHRVVHTTGMVSKPTYPRLSVPSRPAIVAAAGVAVVGFVFYLAGPALTVFVVGTLVAVVLDPIVTWLTRRGLPRTMSAAVVVVVATLVTAATGLLVAIRVIAETTSFGAAVPGWIQRVREWYLNASMSTDLRALVDAAGRDMSRRVADVDLSAIALDLGSSAISLLLITFGLLPFFLFFVLADRPRRVRHLIAAIPSPWRRDIVAMGDIVIRSLTSYLRGEAMLMALLGVLTWAGLQGLAAAVDPRLGEFALFLAFLAAASELLPMIGPWIATAPAIAFAATVSPEATVAVGGLYLLIAIIEGQFLVPVIQGRQFSLHPIAVAVALVTGGAVMGLLGAIIALPVLAAGSEIFRYVFRRSTMPGPRRLPSRSH
jgi:predicted PurR-regulated permease PerM